MVTIVARQAALAVAINGSAITHVVSASWKAGFNVPYPEASVVVTQLPVGFDQNQTLQIVAGNGTNNSVVRFLGRTRDPDYDGSASGNVTIRGVGQLERAYTYENSEEGTGDEVLGLTLFDLIGADNGTDATVVKAVLDKVGISYTAANIGGTGVTFGTLNGDDEAVYLWSSGDNPTGFEGEGGAGETALEYIARWDRVSAVHPGTFAAAGSTSANSPGAITAPVGFYRTFETLGGVVYRKLIGGRPRGTPDYTFTGGVDIRTGRITRKFPLANRFIAVGYDYGEEEITRFVMQSSSPPFLPSTVKYTAPTISSPMIEKTAENDAGSGMSAEKVTYAIEPDLNRIIVAGTITTGRDDPIGPGATVLVQGGPGGALGHLGTGENLWVQSVSGRVDASGFSQEFEVLGGGVPDTFLPAVPQ